MYAYVADSVSVERKLEHHCPRFTLRLYKLIGFLLRVTALKPFLSALQDVCTYANTFLKIIKRGGCIFCVCVCVSLCEVTADALEML